MCNILYINVIYDNPKIKKTVFKRGSFRSRMWKTTEKSTAGRDIVSRIVNVEKRGEGVFYVSINGSLDFDSYVEVQAAIKPLLESATKVIMVNMKNVDYISSVGIGVILKAKIFMEEKGGKFIMVELKPQVQTVFEIIKALPSMQIFENMKEVDDYFMKIQMDEMEKYKRRMGNNE